MKIFNWMHRHRYSVQSPDVVSLDQDGLSGDLIKRSRPSGETADKEPLLEQDSRAVENWELDRILTIGTLAINPFENMINQEEGEDMNTCNEYDQQDDIEMYNMPSFRDEALMKCNNEIEIFNEANNVDETKKGNRVTLQDLFLADGFDTKLVEELKADYEYCQDNSDIRAMKKTKKRNMNMYSKLPAALARKKGFPFNPKKLIPGVVDDEIGSLKKLKMFVTRMMKRKIHPDMGARLKKKVQGKLNGGVSGKIEEHDHTNEEEECSNESVSLLS